MSTATPTPSAPPAAELEAPPAAAAAAAHPPARPRTSWPPPRRNGGTRSKCYKALLPRKSPAGTAPRSPPAEPAPGSPPARPSTPGTPTLSSIPAPTQQALRTLEWVHRRENLVVCGPSGHRQDVPARSPRPARRRTRHCTFAWFTLEDLGVLVRRHRADDTVTKAITRILRADLVCVDDIGLLPVAPDAAEGLYRLVDAAYEKRSIAFIAPTSTPPDSTS